MFIQRFILSSNRISINMPRFVVFHSHQKGPARVEAMADIMKRFDRMRRTRDTVKVSFCWSALLVFDVLLQSAG
jgi:hypothetical protein